MTARMETQLTTSSSTTHLVERVSIDTAVPFTEYRRRFENAVPPFDAAEVSALAQAGAPWPDIVDAVNKRAPHGFLIFGVLDPTEQFTVAGHSRAVVQYLVGNHTIAERMYRHVPAVMLYAPLRLLLTEQDDGSARVTFDRPSTLFGSFGVDEVTSVGKELDEKLDGLLEVLASGRVGTVDSTRPVLP